MALAALLATSGHAVAQCGDCDHDGAVTVPELTTAVGNALGGPVVQPTFPPLPACPNLTPGQRITIQGGKFVIIEQELTLEGSSDSYLIRYPVLDDGSISIFTFSLPRGCGSFSSQVCPEVTIGLGPICGFDARYRVYGSTSGSYFDTVPGKGSYSSTAIAAVSLEVKVRDGYQLFTLSLDAGGTTATAEVQSLATSGYSTLTLSGKPATPNVAPFVARARELIRYVSIRKR